MTMQEELEMYEKVEAAVGSDVLDSSQETRLRLFSLLSDDLHHGT